MRETIRTLIAEGLIAALIDGVMAIARKHKLFVVEDCALAIGTYYKGIHAGLHGDVGVFSFYPVKHMTTCEGGMAVTDDAHLAAHMRRFRNHGIDSDHRKREASSFMISLVPP